MKIYTVGILVLNSMLVSASSFATEHVSIVRFNTSFGFYHTYAEVISKNSSSVHVWLQECKSDACIDASPIVEKEFPLSEVVFEIPCMDLPSKTGVQVCEGDSVMMRGTKRPVRINMLFADGSMTVLKTKYDYRFVKRSHIKRITRKMDRV